ncbi:MAG TPA: NAD(P)H-dependent oxidoreductase [Hyphomonadaceae bacterium]|jgi:NAD(P)H-dependent FMN reductase|nr:NAD(P)H-dependent oxidoreductase [Hyphomonadaceae bacterium]
MLNFALIIGSTRPNRFADHTAKFITDGASARKDFSLDVLDLRDHPLPFFNEPTPPAYFPEGRFSDPAAEAWRQKIGKYDGFIATVSEYNHGPTAVLKNAFDSAFFEWQRKPVGFIGHGGTGGVRAIEQLRGIVIELQMAPIKQEINVARDSYLGVLQGKPLDGVPHLVDARTALFDNMVWWGNALKAARTAQSAQANAA